MKILCIGTTPAVQRVMVFRKMTLDAVNRAGVTFEGPAGKSVNVAKVLKSLGAHPVATGFLGGDRGEFLRAALTDKGIESDFITVSARTRECVTVIDESAGTHTELVEESGPVMPVDFGKLMAVIQRRLAECRAVVMSGSIVSGGPANFYFDCIRLSGDAGVLSVVDAQGLALIEALKAKPGLVKPNRLELAATVGRELNDEAAVMRAMGELCERGARRVAVTDGKKATLAFDGKSHWRITVPQVKVVNSIGSGDAFAAGAVLRLICGDDLGEACRWGNAAGAANAITPTPGDLSFLDLERLAREVRVQQI